MNASVKDVEDVQRVLAREAELEAMLVSLMAAPLAPIRTSLEEICASTKSQGEQILKARRALYAAIEEANARQKEELEHAVEALQGEIEARLDRVVEQVAVLMPKLESMGVGVAALASRIDDCESHLAHEVVTLKREFHLARRRSMYWAAAIGGGIVLSISIGIWALLGLG